MQRVLVRCTAFRVTSCVRIVVMYIVSEEDIEEPIRKLSHVYAYKFDLISTLSCSDDPVKGLDKHFLDANSWYSGAMLWRRVSAVAGWPVMVQCTWTECDTFVLYIRDCSTSQLRAQCRSMRLDFTSTSPLRGTVTLLDHCSGFIGQLSWIGATVCTLFRPESFQAGAGAGRDAPRM